MSTEQLSYRLRESKAMAKIAEQRKIIEAESESKSEAEREIRAHEIYNVGKRAHLDHVMIVNAISQNMSIEDFTDLALDTLKERQESVTISNPENEFSLLRFIRNKVEGNSNDAREQKVIDDNFCERGVGKQTTRGTLLPNSILNPPISKRTLTAGTNTAGGYTINDEIQSLIEPLDPEAPIYAHSRKLYPTGPWSAPKKDSRSVATFTGETAAAVESNPTFSAIQQSPKHLAAWTTVTRELISSSAIDIEALIRSDLRIAMRLGIERNLLRATGASGQPFGLENNADIQVLTRASASAVTFDEVLEVEEKVLGSNVAILGDGTGVLKSGEKDPRMQNFMRRFGLIWVVSPKMRRLLKLAKEPGTGASSPLWNTGNKGNDDIVVFGDGTQEQPTVLGYPAYVSTYITDNSIFFGHFGDLTFSQFGKIDITIDPYTLGQRGITRIFCHLDVDWFLRHSESIVRLSA